MTKVTILLLHFLIIYSCQPTRKLPEGSYLLAKNELVVNSKDVAKTEIQRYIRQRPNKKILGFRFHLWLFNLAKEEKDNKINRWLRKSGEAPVIYAEDLRVRSQQQMELYLKSIGYYDASVIDTVKIKGKYAFPQYYINVNQAYTIRKIQYVFDDTAIHRFVLSDTALSLIRPGAPFDQNILQSERSRIERSLKNQGFYNFNQEYVYYKVDSALKNHQADIFVGISKYVYRDSSNLLHSVPHRQYQIRNVYVDPQYNPVAIDTFQSFDTLSIDSLLFLQRGPYKHHPHVIAQMILIHPNSQFSLKDVDDSYKKLSLLRNFRFINIIFKENYSEKSPDGNYPLDCYIQLTPFMNQSYQAELEGTNNNGNFGTAINLSYQHKNVFKRAYIFDFKIRGAYEAMRKKDDKGKLLDTLFHTFEYGAEARLTIPQFLIPFRGEEFTRKYSPRTSFMISYNFQQRPDYKRNMALASFGYNWKPTPFETWVVNPFEVNYILPNITDNDFQKYVDTTFLRYSYQKNLINSFSGSYVFTNQTDKNTRAHYFSFRGESAGILLRGYSKLLNRPHDSLYVYSLFGIDFAQFVKTDLEYRFYLPMNESDKIVYRFFAGVGVPYYNSKSMPFVRRYFGGGPNSLRGWQIRTLGPGSSPNIKQYSFPNQTGDMKIEGNIEYRFNLTKKIEGAMFVDAGNVWNVQEDDPSGSKFNLLTFYDQIAVGSGVGLRFDFSFFVFRLDMGVKTRDPSAEKGSRWTYGKDYLSSQNINYYIAIGYPF